MNTLTCMQLHSVIQEKCSCLQACLQSTVEMFVSASLSAKHEFFAAQPSR